MRVVVIGAGFAGVSAAFAARRAGAHVTVVHAGPGASALYSGAVDIGRSPVSLSDELSELASSLGLHLSRETVVATREGIVRGAAGRDTALLDLAPLAGKRVALVDVARDDWDAPLLARSLAESAWAQSTRTRFELVPLALIEKGYQRRVASFDFAAGFERAERPAWLAAVLRAHAGPDAWLLGPWLGVRRDLARELSASVGVPVGEVTSPPGGVAGARFERRRDSLLAELRADVVVARALRVSKAARMTVSLDTGANLEASALVVACGGVVSGAIHLSGALSGAERAGFRLEIAGLPAPSFRGEPAGSVSTLFGVDLAARGLALLERVGLPVAPSSAVLGEGRCFACGDVTAPQPPSVGHALASGLVAGKAAAASALRD